MLFYVMMGPNFKTIAVIVRVAKLLKLVTQHFLCFKFGFSVVGVRKMAH